MLIKRGFHRTSALLKRFGRKMIPNNLAHGTNFTIGTSALMTVLYIFNSGALADHNDYASRVAVLESRVEIQGQVIQATLDTVKNEIATSRQEFNQRFQSLDRKIDKNQDRIIELLSSGRG